MFLTNYSLTKFDNVVFFVVGLLDLVVCNQFYRAMFDIDVMFHPEG